MPSSNATKQQENNASDILYRIAKGDKTAVEQCIEVYGRLVWSAAKRYCYTTEDAEDAVQDIFIDIWRYAGRFDAEKSPEISFIMLIARRRLIDWVRKSNSRPQISFSETVLENQSSDEHKKMQLHIELKDALQGLDKLPPKQKAVVQMTMFGGMSHLEISRTTGLPFGTVKSHIRRGFQKIRSFIVD